MGATCFTVRVLKINTSQLAVTAQQCCQEDFASFFSMLKNAATKNRHSTRWGIACRTIFYSSSPKLHLAQILDGKLWAKTRNAAASTTQSILGHMHRSGSTKQPSTNSIHVEDPSAHPSSPPCGDIFKRKSTTDWSALMPSLRLSVCSCTEIRRCYDARAFLDLQPGLANGFILQMWFKMQQWERKVWCIHWHEDLSDQRKCTKPFTKGAFAVCSWRSLLLTELNRLHWEKWGRGESRLDC